ncbi:MAG: winged helix DNA-binding domain-containing protein [Chloroflexia bacterium]
MTWREVWARRLTRHSLSAPAPAARLAEVAGAVCGIHAQVMPAAEVSLGVRVAGVTRQDIRAALWDKRSLVKTYGIRGTVHLFPADELPLWMAALRACPPPDPKWLASKGLDMQQLDLLVSAVGDALDGQRLTLTQLGDAVVQRAGAWAGEETAPAWGENWPRWRMALGAAAVAGRLCFGPNVGTAVTFVRADQWAGPWHDMDPGAALAEILRRYLHAYGPATPRDFAQWFSIPAATARNAAATIADELEEVDVEGQKSFLLVADAAAEEPPVSESVRLLPHFDCYMIGCHPRAQLVPPAWAERVLPHGQAGPVPVLLVDGTVGGVWTRQAKGHRVELRVEPFTPLTSGQQDLLEAEAGRIGEILEAAPALTVGSVMVRPHL